LSGPEGGLFVKYTKNEKNIKNSEPIKNAQPHRIVVVVVVVVVINITVRNRGNDLNDHYSLILFQKLKKNILCIIFMSDDIYLYGRLRSCLFRLVSMQKRPKKKYTLPPPTHVYLSTYAISQCLLYYYVFCYCIIIINLFLYLMSMIIILAFITI